MTSQESPNYVPYEHHPDIFLGTSLHNSRENAETDFLFSYVTLRKFRETLFWKCCRNIFIVLFNVTLPNVYMKY